MNSSRKIFRLCTLSLLAATLFAVNSHAQLTLDGSGIYSENFNGIGGGLPTGWSVRTGANATNLGTAATLNTAAVNWSTGTGQFANYASTISNSGTNYNGTEPGGAGSTQATSTNRAPGIRQTASFGDPGAAFVLQLANTLGFTNFQVGLDFLMLSVQNQSTVWRLQYGIGNTPTAFTTVATYFDPGVFGATHTNVSFNGALDNQTENVWIRVVALNGAVGPNSRDTFGIDNFALTATPTTAVTNPPTITVQPQSRTNAVFTTATFSVTVTGTHPFTYQWKKDNNNMADGGNVSGVNSSVLTITNLTAAADNGTYSCAITNAAGSTNTVGATLTVLDPGIVTQPVSSTNLLGENHLFSVTANSTLPVEYQWRKGGNNIAGATTNSLTISNISSAEVTNYSVVVSNSLGAVTSSVVSLSLLTTPTTEIAQWNFNDTGSAASPAASIGGGVATLLNGVVGSFQAGAPQDTASPDTNINFGWQTTTYMGAANSTTSNKTAGVQFKFSTVGYKDIFLSWHQRQSGGSSRHTRMQYSTDGTTFTDFHKITRTTTDFDREVVDLSSVPAVNNNPNFAFRVVTEFESTALNGAGNPSYVPSISTGTYASSGTIRFDWLNVFGNVDSAVTPIPLNYQVSGTDIILSWSNPAFALQSAPLVTGAYTNVGVGSPYTNALSGGQKYFRLRAP